MILMSRRTFSAANITQYRPIEGLSAWSADRSASRKRDRDCSSPSGHSEQMSF
jgi:hypothetical protein